MDPAVAASPVSGPPLTFEDGLGERRYTTGAANEPLEVLRLSTVLSTVSSFEFALRERASRLANFRHQSYGHVRAVEPDKLTSTLSVVSDYVAGIRLSKLLADAEKRSLPLEINSARCLIRQLVSAVAAWEETLRDLWHGAIAPERIIVTPDGRVIIVEYVLGSALEQLRYTRPEYWRQLRIPLPDGVGPLSFDSRVDVMQIGMVALAAILGRPLVSDEYPDRIKELVGGAALRLATDGVEPMSSDLREWLYRALQLDPHWSFVSATDARADLEVALGSEDRAAELGALRRFLAQCAVADASATTSQVVGTEPAPSTQETAQLDAAASTRDVPGLDGAADIDLGPRIEALKSFLARYPPREQADKPSAKPAVTSSGDAALPASPAPKVQQALDSRVEAARVDSSAPPSPGENASSLEAVPLDQAADPQPILQSKAQQWRSALPVWALTLRSRWIAGGLTIVAILAALAFAGLRSGPPAAPEATGALTVATNPVGVSVLIDGTSRGVTPLSVNLSPGAHVVELVTGTERRQIPVSITAGGEVSQFLELPRAAPAVGELLVRTNPPGASVIVDGRPVGRAPLTVRDMSPGAHIVVMHHESGSATERVFIESGRTTSLVSMANSPPANAAGWISIKAPTDVQVYENRRLVGSSSIDRIMLPVGRHELEIVNEPLGYRVVHAVQVTAGEVSPIALQWPQGSLALNAIPWAEVWIDGKLIGETPIGSVSVPIGVHEVVFRHPELGERRSAVTVIIGKPMKVGVDMGAK